MPILRLPFIFLCAALAGFSVPAQNSVLLYQGQLRDAGQPANGSYEFRFALADAASEGNYLGRPLTNSAVTVSNGEFSASLDFGAAVFDGTARWLEIGVRTNGSAEPFVTLRPRQPILPTPYAVHAYTAGLATNLVGGGALLTSLPASNLVGVIPPGRLPLIGSNQINSATDAAYRATDTNAILGFARTNLIGPVINVKDFGAVGDARTDDSAAVAAAFDAASHQGMTLYFPAGSFSVNTQLFVTLSWSPRQGFATFSKLRVVGDGSSATVLRFTGTNGTLLTASNVVLELNSLTLQNAGVGRNNGISVTGESGAHTLRDVAIERFTGWGANFEGGAGGCVYSSGFYACGIGLKLPGYCDGWTVDARVDVCNVGIELGGAAQWPAFGKYDQANAARIRLVGSRNNYGVVVGKGAGTDISGYLEACTNAFVAIGHPPDLYPTNQDSYVGTVELHSFAGLQFWGFTNGVKVFTKPDSLKIYNARCIGDAAVMVQIVNPAANNASYTFEKVLAANFLAFSDGRRVPNENWPTAGSALVNPEPTRIYYGSRQVMNWSQESFNAVGKLNLNGTGAGTANLYSGGDRDYFQLLGSNTTNSFREHSFKIGMLPYTSDFVPCTMMFGSTTAANYYDLFLGGGTGLGRAANHVEIWTGNPTSPGPGNLVLRCYNDGSASFGQSASWAGPNSLSVQGNLKFGGTASGNGAGLTNLAIASVNGLSAALAARTGPTASNSIPVALNLINGSVAVNAALGTHFRLTLTDNLTIDSPTGGSDGQRITLELIQDATGSRTASFGSKFSFGSDLSSLALSTDAGKRDFIEAVYNRASDKWYVVSFLRGY